MMQGMARRLTSPIFVGRSEEVNTLLSAADSAASDHPSLVLVGGEAGVGKSRLVEEAVARLRASDWLVIEGGAVALGEDGLPFGPIVEALRSLVRQVDPERIADAAGPSLPELARLVPEVSALGGEAAATGQNEWLQTRIFEGALRLLGRLGETSPVMLVIEDLHWADRSTRDLLAFLTRNARAERLLMVATFRSDELHRRHPLTAWLAETERQPSVERIHLGRFERDEVVELLTGIAGAPPVAALVDSIVRRSDGNAFFAEELAAAAEEPGRKRERLPETLRGVLQVRLAAGSEAAGRLVEIAAVAGRQVDHELLAEVCGLPEPELGLALRSAIDAQLLFVDQDGSVERYRFRHALVEEAAYDELLPSERRVLHAAYARAIEGRPAGAGVAAATRLVEIAHHWRAAQDPARALGAAIAAGDASRTVYAYAEAGRQYERAIELWDLVPADDRPTDRDLADLFDAASATATLVGDASHAVDLARGAIELIDAASGSADDLGRRARARERFGYASWLAGDSATSIRLLEEAIDLLEGAPPSTDQARVLAGLAGNLMLAGRCAESVPFAERAIESARLVGAQAIEARALDILGVDRANLGSIAAGIDLLRQALAIAMAADDPIEVPRSYANLGSLLEFGGFVEEALEVSLAGAESTGRYGGELSFRWLLETNGAAMLIELGRYPEAAALLEQNVKHVLPGVSTMHLYVTYAHLLMRTGDLVTAARHLDLARDEASHMDDAQFAIDLHMIGTGIAVWSGDPAAAFQLARDGLDRLVDMDDAILVGQLVMPAMHAAADIAVRARTARDPAAADGAVVDARAVVDRYRAATTSLPVQDELATHELGWRMAICTAELARAAGEDDPGTWEAIRPAVAARPAPFLEAYVLWREAEAWAGRGDLAAAVAPLREAHAIAARIGASILEAEIAGLGRRLRIDLSSRDGRRSVEAASPVLETGASVEPAAPADPFGLTSREREVLSLVAEGYTNRRIAATLFISESTAGVHVSHILSKLGVETRTEAATVAVRLGLDQPAG
jgi:DNA-binding CsgD family transcriptional regulator